MKFIYNKIIYNKKNQNLPSFLHVNINLISSERTFLMSQWCQGFYCYLFSAIDFNNVFNFYFIFYTLKFMKAKSVSILPRDNILFLGTKIVFIQSILNKSWKRCWKITICRTRQLQNERATEFRNSKQVNSGIIQV